MNSLKIHAGSDNFGWFIFTQITIAVWFYFRIVLKIYIQSVSSNKIIVIEITMEWHNYLHKIPIDITQHGKYKYKYLQLYYNTVKIRTCLSSNLFLFFKSLRVSSGDFNWSQYNTFDMNLKCISRWYAHHIEGSSQSIKNCEILSVRF